MAVLTRESVDELLKKLDVDGYVILRDVVSQDRLEQFHTELMRQFHDVRDEGRLFSGGGMITGHLNCFPGEHARFIYEEIADYGIVEVARARDAASAERPRATLNFNLPGSVAQHYHMDGLYTDEFLICNVAVVDTDVHNGAFDVLPGTHREFMKFWRYAVERKYRLSTRVPLRQGDAILRLSTTWHRGTPNLSDTARPMAAITFGELSAPEGDPFAVNGGEMAFYPNWYGTDRLGQLRERTYAALPLSYSAYRFVRSLYGKKGYSTF